MNKKILIIDDDRELCMELTDILIDEGFMIDNAHDGMTGLNRIIKNDYDLILLDLKIPILSGYEILSNIKKNHLPVKVLVLSGSPKLKNPELEKNEADEKNYEILSMADAFINKPFNVIEFIETVKKLTGFQQE
jgi:DNA-binding response OmpR family regulator